MKILVSAYSCEPGVGSEPGIGWNSACVLAEKHEVWVLTRPDESGEKIQAELARNPNPRLHFVYCTTPGLARLWRWGQSGPMQIHYYLWQITAFYTARRLHRQIGFDVVHHVTFGKYSTPSFLHWLPVPFVWGPVGGGESAPWRFWLGFSFRAWVYELARLIWRTIGEFDPWTRVTARRAAAAFAVTQDTAERMRQLGARSVKILPAVTLTSEEFERLRTVPDAPAGPLRLISVGRLLHWKGFDLGLRAFAQALQQASAAFKDYWIVGDGPELVRLMRLAHQLGIADRVRFLGRKTRNDTLSLLGDCHLLLHPSLHDSGGMVCLEAMAAGRPVVCLNLSGPGEIVSVNAGIRIAACRPHDAITGLTEALKMLAENPALRMRMGECARLHAAERYCSSAWSRTITREYEQIVPSPPLRIEGS